MSAVKRGKARASAGLKTGAGSSASAKVSSNGSSSKLSQKHRSGEAAGHSSIFNSSQAGPSSSTSMRRRQDFSPQSFESESDMDDEDEEEELVHESEDEFEQYRNESAPSYAQYMGDSDLENDGGDSDDDSENMDDEDSMHEESDDGREYMNDVQADLQQIPLETLIKAQKKLAKLEKSSSSKAKGKSVARDGGDGEEDLEESGTSTRRGRTEARRGVVADLPSAKQREAKNKISRPKARDSKHAPTEMTSKRAVPRFRQVVEVERTNRRDPRFDALSGDLDNTRFRTSYSFITEARKEEIQRLKFAISQARKRKGAIDQDELDTMSENLQKLQSKQAEAERQQRQANVMSDWKHQEKEKRAAGKSEFYLKRGEKKKIVESKRMEEVSKDKRRLRKVLKRKDQAEKKKSFKTAPPVRQM